MTSAERLPELLDLAERPRVHDWSLRAALVRYAQPQPVRASEVYELVRRIELGLRPHLKRLQRHGLDAEGEDPVLLGVLEAAEALDRLGDVLTAWAVERAGARPDADVVAAIADVTRRLDEAGAAREERQAPPRGARSRG